jgi:hypothetical protein
MGKRKWTRESVIARLRELKSNKVDISPKGLSKEYGGLYTSGRRLFGGSSEMYHAAGISFELNRRLSNISKARVKWTKESVVHRLRELQSCGEDISPQKLFKKHGGLYYAGIGLFGTSSAMYQAAGFPPSVFRRTPPDYWTKGRVIAELKSLYASGQDMSYDTMARDHLSLYHAGRGRFGSYSKALETAGVPYDRFRKSHAPWTDEDIIRSIRSLWEQHFDLSSSNMQEKQQSLYLAGQRRYDSWFNALDAAGIPGEKYRKLPKRKKRTHMQSWTGAKVIAEIRKLADAGEDLSHSVIMNKHPALEGAARARFGNSWHKAIEAAGIDSAKSRKQKPPGYWTKSRVITDLQVMFAKKADLREIAIRKNHPDLLTQAEKRFGGYYPALAAAGIAVEDYRRYRPDGYWSKVRVIEEIQKLSSLGEDLSYSAMAEHDTALIHGAERAFGKYEKAFQPAGMDYEKIRKDKMMESFIGHVFEEYLEEMMSVLGWKVRAQQRVRTGKDVVRPDFVESDTGKWIDAKVDSWSPGVAATILKYLEFRDEILIIYLKGKKRKWPSSDAEIRPVSDYFPALLANGREDLVHDFEKLKKGIVRPELQSELERFSKGFYTKHK